MKVIIAGSRTILNKALVYAAIEESGFADQITEVVSGGARGVDAIGEQWAQERGIPIKRFPADWDQYGRSAGPRRNGLMGAYADALIAVRVGWSTGTDNMVSQARALGLRVYVKNLNEDMPRATGERAGE